MPPILPGSFLQMFSIRNMDIGKFSSAFLVNSFLKSKYDEQPNGSRSKDRFNYIYFAKDLMHLWLYNHHSKETLQC